MWVEFVGSLLCSERFFPGYSGFHQCGPGSIPGSDAICGLSLLVLYSAPRDFSPGSPVFPSHQKLTFDLICVDLISCLPN